MSETRTSLQLFGLFVLLNSNFRPRRLSCIISFAKSKAEGGRVKVIHAGVRFQTIIALTVLVSSILLVGQAQASCGTSGQSGPYTSGDIITNRTLHTLNCCCCWTNECDPSITSSNTVWGWCCDQANPFCFTEDYHTSNTVRPVAHAGEYNPVDDQGRPIAIGLCWTTEDSTECSCFPSGHSVCSRVGYGSPAIIWSCVACPPNTPSC
jgi:hypothetical protein